MTDLRKDLPPLPERMRGLPVDHRGFPVPWFVWINDEGVPDFRVIRPGGIALAIKKRCCWICGHPLGKFLTFMIGPMCVINRVTSEPPSHSECAEFAARACPFMLRPKMRRNEHELPEKYVKPAGIHLDRNPGAVCEWITKSFKPFRVSRPGAHDGILLDIGEPETVLWWAEGREATRAEVQASIDGGFPDLMALAERDGPDAVSALKRKVEEAQGYLPRA